MSWGAPPPLLRLPAALVLLFILHLSTVQSQHVTSTSESHTYYYPSFHTYYYPSFHTVDNDTDLALLKDAKYSNGAIQITPDARNAASYLQNKTGRVFLTQSFKLWEHIYPSSNATDGQYVASFNTTFDISIFRTDNTTPGEGLAFLIASNLAGPPPGSEGGYLGLPNPSLDNDTKNYFVAVELDTAKEAYDLNDNHVGLDINSVNSTLTANLSFLIAPVNPTNYTVWVDYDGGARHIWVYMEVQDKSKPSSAVLDAPLDLSQHLLQKSYFGFSASTGKKYQVNQVLSWNLTVEILHKDKRRMPVWELGLIIGGAILAVLGLMTGLCVGRSVIRRRKVRNAPNVLVLGTLKTLPGTPREFKFKELNKATNNFHEKRMLGKGGFGEVYRGVLPEENKEVAVKKFSRGSSCVNDFLKEVIVINRLRHKHLVPLLGWCHTNGMPLLVYDYMPNGSLDQHLFGEPDKPTLSWERRYNVITGVASALHYLHDQYDQKVVHRDLKASNIMLDANFNARLGDFGLARALDNDRTSYAELELGGFPGTMGYVAPECFRTGKATCKSDVFGFGTVVLEVVCGRRPRYDFMGFKFLHVWVWELHGEDRIMEAVDPRLGEDFNRPDAQRLLLLGLACCHPIPGQRPKTEAVVQIVSRAVAPPAVPRFIPDLVWQSGPVEE